MVMLRSGHYDPFEDRFDDWVKRWFKTGPSGRAYSREPERFDLATSNQMKYWAYHTPFLGDFIKSVDTWESANAYLETHNMTWADVDPAAMASKFDTKIGRITMSVSKNIAKLYR